MRIGIDISKALGPPDGIGRYTAGLLTGLAKLAEAGELEDCQFLLYSLHQPWPRGEGTALPTSLEFPGEATGRRTPTHGEVDLFHCTTHSVPRGYRGPLLFTLYDLTFLTLPRAHTLDNRLHCTRGLARALARGARLSTISESSRRELVSHLSLGKVAGEEITVVYPAADDRFAVVPEAEMWRVREAHGLDQPYLLSVGTREPRKNLPRLIEAFAALPSSVVGDRLLVIVGAEGWPGGEEEEGPGAVVARLGLDERVRFLGRVADTDLPGLYGAADLFAYPSLAEGFGLPPLEAMACGTAVVTSDSSSLPEVVGEAAMLVEPAKVASIRDGMARLLGDPEFAARLRQAGLERARRFSWEQSARGLVESYRAVLGVETVGLQTGHPPCPSENAQ